MQPNSNLPGRAVYLIDGTRTPFLRAGSKPGPFRASDLALQCGRPLLARQPFTADQLDEVILGCVSPGAEEANIARVVSLRLGCGERVPAWSVQRNCASGMQALDSAAQQIASGRSELVLAGGTESMSHYPVMLNEMMVGWLGAWGRARGLPARARQLAQLRPAHFRLVVALLKGLSDPLVGLSMGQTAERLAHDFDISREQMDSYAVQSHQRLAGARNSGALDEIEPMIDRNGNAYADDSGLRADTDRASLGRLRPVFDRPVGRVTAGNSAQITDGATLLLLASAEAVERYGLNVRARLIDSQWSALDPAQMGLGPAHAISDLLQRRQLQTGDIDYWEINEAFAAQVLACLAALQDPVYCRQQLGSEPYAAIDRQRLNIDGGGISLGHPLGASGARIVLHLLAVLERKQAATGIASLCIGGGQGGAMLIERTTEINHV